MSNWENHKHSTRDKSVDRERERDAGVKHGERERVREKWRQKDKRERLSRLREHCYVWASQAYISLIHANQCGCQHLRQGHNGPFMLAKAQHSSWLLQGSNYWTYPANTPCLWLQKLSTPTFKWQQLDNTGISNRNAALLHLAHVYAHSRPSHRLLFWIPFCQLSEHG